MPRGQVSAAGEERVAQNGYHYVRTGNGWRLKHHIVAEEKLGRPLKPSETACFADKDRTNFNPKNIVIKTKGASSINKRIAVIEATVKELLAEREILLKQREALKAKAS